MSNEVKRLYRSRKERMLGGVCGGLGEYLSIDATIIRLIFVITALWGGAGIIVYIAMLLVVPEEPQEAGEAAAPPAEDEEQSQA
jgi:phage shock protein C